MHTNHKPSWLKAITGSTCLGLLPYLERALYTTTHIDLVDSLAWFIVAFAALGAVAGAIFSPRAALGGIFSCVIGLWLLTMLDFIGGGGDGDLFYVLGAFGSAVFAATGLAAGVLRRRFASRGRVA